MQPNTFVKHGMTKMVAGSVVHPELSGLRLVLAFAQEYASDKKPTFDQYPLYDVLDKKWNVAKREIKAWFAERSGFKLGNLKNTIVQSDIQLVHALVYDKDGNLDTKALTTAVKKLVEMAKYERASVHVSTLLTEAVPQLTEMLQKQAIEQGVSVYYYTNDVPPQTK